MRKIKSQLFKITVILLMVYFVYSIFYESNESLAAKKRFNKENIADEVNNEKIHRENFQVKCPI